jgi:Tfp pilus assembly protein PilE
MFSLNQKEGKWPPSLLRCLGKPFRKIKTDRYFLSTAKRDAGYSFVEVLVSTLIVVIFTVGLSVAFKNALSIEQNYRRESAVRTALARNLAYAERYLSLTKNFSGVTNFYPLETGGISFETNHWLSVKNSCISDAEGQMRFQVESMDPRYSSPGDYIHKKDFSGYGSLRIAPASIVEARLDGNGEMRRLVLRADFPVETENGTETNTIEVSRPVRLWNSE